MTSNAVDPTRLSVRGFGEYRPAAENAPDNKGNAANRRVGDLYRASGHVSPQDREFQAPDLVDQGLFLYILSGSGNCLSPVRYRSLKSAEDAEKTTIK